MRTIQQTFDAVIAAGHYIETCVSGVSSEFMCNAIRHAGYHGTITEADGRKALRSIEQYMCVALGAARGRTLYDALLDNGKCTEFKDRLAIYQNWAKRPRKFNKRVQ
jgi:hypothetical protein